MHQWKFLLWNPCILGPVRQDSEPFVDAAMTKALGMCMRVVGLEDASCCRRQRRRTGRTGRYDQERLSLKSRVRDFVHLLEVTCGAQVLREKLHNRVLRVGTVCSGCDIFASWADAVAGELRRRLDIRLEFR